MAHGLELSLSRSRISVWSSVAVVIAIFFGLIADVTLVFYTGETTTKILGRLSLATDTSIPTFLSSLLLLSCAALLALAGKAEHDLGAQKVWPWYFLSVIFAILAVDEVAMLHELSGQVLTRIVPQVEALGPAFYYAWTLIALPALLGLTVVLAPWIFALPKGTRLLFLASAATFVAGAVGVEMVNSAIDLATTGRSLTYTLLTVCEETLEFAGVLLFQFALLRHLGKLGFDVKIVLHRVPIGTREPVPDQQESRPYAHRRGAAFR